MKKYIAVNYNDPNVTLENEEYLSLLLTYN